MTDNYSYSQTQLKKKAEGPFGLSGDSKFGLGSLSTSNPDQPGRGSQTPPQDQGGEAEQEGGTGGGGDGGGLPDGSSGSLLRHNGSAWVAIGPPGGDSIEGLLVNSQDSYYYVSGNDLVGLRSVCVFNGDNWVPLNAPETGTHVLGIVDNEIQWIETEECEE